MFSAVPFVQDASRSLEKSCELQKISLSENRVDTIYPSDILYKYILKVEPIVFIMIYSWFSCYVIKF